MLLKDLFKAKGLTFAVYTVVALILLNTVLFFYFSYLQRQAARHEGDLLFLKPRVEQVKQGITAVEFSSQQFMLNRDDQSLSNYGELIQSASKNLDSLTYHMKRLEADPALIASVDEGASKSLNAHEQFMATVHGGDSAQVITNFNQLQSSFQVSNNVLTEVTASEDNLYLVKSARITGVMQVSQILLLISIPFLLLLALAHRKNKEKLIAFNRDIEESNRKYVFNAMDNVNYENDEEIKTRLLTNLKKASEFIQQVANGNYSIKWGGITDDNREMNRENIAGELIRMREQMKQVKEQDEMRIWTTEGLSMFGELIRKHQDNFESLSDNFISNVVKYLKAKVGGLFILEEEDEGKQFLELKACYAYERKKYISKRVEIGEGLIGQTFLEGQTIHLKEIPNDYLLITSGLGGTNPKSLVVIPLRTSERIEGVLEIASFNEFKPHEIEFLEKLGEQLASSVISVRTAEKTKSLLEVSQQQSEEMRAQEEEMRQNMEELEATQEQMHRQMNELSTLKQTLEKEQYLFGALMGNIPDAIYFKDKESKFIRISAYLAKHFKSSEEELMGKSDFDFQDESHAREAYEDEQNIMKTMKPKIDYVEKEVLADGSEHYVSTTKMPLVNLQGEVVGTFGISRDVTKLKTLENDVKKKEQELREEEKQHKLKIRQLEMALEEAQMELEKLKKK